MYNLKHDYKLKYNNGKSLITGINFSGLTPDCGTYMVLGNDNENKLYFWKDKYFVEITKFPNDLPKNSIITHLYGGNYYNKQYDTYVGAYIMFNNDINYIYMLNEHRFNKLQKLPELYYNRSYLSTRIIIGKFVAICMIIFMSAILLWQIVL